MDIIICLTFYPFRCRIDIIGGLPLFGHFIERKGILPLEDINVSSAPSSNQQDVNSETGQRDTDFAVHKGMNVIIKEGFTEKCLTPSLQTHSPNFADLDTLQQEAVWLETAIRARISVSSKTVETSYLQTRNSPHMTHLLFRTCVLMAWLTLDHMFMESESKGLCPTIQFRPNLKTSSSYLKLKI
jgi:hypothetical protein